MKTLKITELISIVKPEYVYLKLKPNNSIKNNSTHKLARSITGLYKNVLESFEKSEEKLINILGREFIIPTKITYQVNPKVSYFIYLEYKKIEFYFIVPKQQLSFIKDKITDVWTNLTVETVSELPPFTQKGTRFQITYKKEDGLSLATDRRNSDLLRSNLNVVEGMQEGDKLGIFYNFLPSSQYGWKHRYRTTIDKVKSSKPVDKDRSSANYIFRSSMSILDGIINSIFGAFVTPKKNNTEFSLLDVFNMNQQQVSLSSGTKRKENSMILTSQIIVMGESTDPIRERNLTRSLAQSFDTISEDNQLIYKPFRKTFKFEDFSTGSQRISVGDEESQNFLALAGRDILEQYNFIEKVETFETEVPEDLQSGVMCIGENVCRGKKQKAYLCNDIRYRNLLALIIGPSRSGKSNLIANLCIDAIENNECCIILDFIENCELSDEVARCFPKEQVLEISCVDISKMQGMGYNEVGFDEDPFEQYVNAKNQTSNMLDLINAINPDDSRLSPKMERYLSAASLIVFNGLGSINDVFNVLQDHIARQKFIRMVPKEQFVYFNEYLVHLTELDELDKEGIIVGTKLNLVTGIIDRLDILKRNPRMELMLKKDIKNNLNMCNEIEKAQLIVIKMPEEAFPTQGERDICTTFWMTKIWLTLQKRSSIIRNKDKRKKLNIIIDEIYQVKNTEKFLTSKLSQIAKFTSKPIISVHYINQLTHMRSEVHSANTSYMLIAGSDKKNHDELKSELYPFEAEDLKNLKAHHSLNYLKTTDGYSCFITELPDVVEKRIKKKKQLENKVDHFSHK